MAEAEFTAVAPLDGGHDRTPFDCGVSALNLYLRNYALQNQQKSIVRNYVTTRADSKVVVAYYSLVYAAIDQKRVPANWQPIASLVTMAPVNSKTSSNLGSAVISLDLSSTTSCPKERWHGVAQALTMGKGLQPLAALPE